MSCKAQKFRTEFTEITKKSIAINNKGNLLEVLIK